MSHFDLARFVASIPVFLLAITLHEVAHAWVAYKCGDDTAKLMGRITLSPIAHLDPIGSLLFVVSSITGVGFGWAKPVPVNPLRFRNWRRDDILVSLAGVTANLLQAIAWAVLLRLSVRYMHHLAPSLAGAATDLCLLGVVLNVVLMVFNLLPIPPLDGSHIALNLLGVRDPIAVARFSAIGTLLLFLFVTTPAFGSLFGAVIEPVVRLLLWGL
ncbi:MAG: site-2 protease family protein [Armatimonadota bacterium]